MDKQIIPRIKDLVTMKDLGGGDGEIQVSSSNIDDIIILLKEKGIKELALSFQEMWCIFIFFSCNGVISSKDKIKFYKNGKLDKFLGIKLTLIEPNGKD